MGKKTGNKSVIISQKTVWILGAFLLIGLFGFIANATNVLPFEELPVSVVGACLEAVVTAIITVFLLKAQTTEQTTAELKKERFAVLFAKKSETYDAYLDDLVAIANRGTLTKEEYLKLVDDLNFKVAMYIDEESSRKVVEQISVLGSRHNDPKAIKTAVFNIALELKQDLQATL